MIESSNLPPPPGSTSPGVLKALASGRPPLVHVVGLRMWRKRAWCPGDLRPAWAHIHGGRSVAAPAVHVPESRFRARVRPALRRCAAAIVADVGRPGSAFRVSGAVCSFDPARAALARLRVAALGRAARRRSTTRFTRPGPASSSSTRTCRTGRRDALAHRGAPLVPRVLTSGCVWVSVCMG